MITMITSNHRQDHRAQQQSATDEEADQEELLVEVPSCIESLVSSGLQLRQLAQLAGQYYIKLLLSYGYAAEPSQSKTDGQSSVSHLSSKNNNHPDDERNPSEPANNNDSNKVVDLNKLAQDRQILESMNSILKILPLLDELSSFVERCFATIELTIKRSTYYLARASKSTGQTSDNLSEDFQLQPNSLRIDPILVGLMDLIFALVSLDKTLKYHTNIRRNFKTFISTCELLLLQHATNNAPSDLLNVPRNDVQRLIEFMNNIKLTLCIESSNLFQQLLENLQHLHLILGSADKTEPGFRLLASLFEHFMVFYGEDFVGFESAPQAFGLNQNQASNHNYNNLRQAKSHSIQMINSSLVPCLHLHSPSDRIFGLASLFVLYFWLFKRSDKRVLKVINQAIARARPSNLLFLEGTNCYILLDEFLRCYLPKLWLDSKNLEFLSNQMELGALDRLDTHKELERLAARVSGWQVELKSQSHSLASGILTNWPKSQLFLIGQGVGLAQEINQSVRSTLAAHLHHNRPMASENLVQLFKMVALLKSVRESLEECEVYVGTYLIRAEHFVRVKLRKLFDVYRKRQLVLKYSERKLDLNSMLVLTAICSRTEMISTSFGRILMSVSLSMLLPSLTLDELSNLNHLLELLRLDTMGRLDRYTNCSFLYWDMPNFAAYYNYAFEEYSNMRGGEVHHFHRAVEDIPNLFAVSNWRPNWSSIDCSWILERRDEFLKLLGEELIDQFKSHFMDKICQEFEIELRLQTHRDLYKDGNNPFRRPMYNFKQFFTSKGYSSRFKLLNQTMDTFYYVEDYINRICYNLTSIAPHDWSTYDQMTNLARLRYHLSFASNQLPAQTLDAGLDLLDIIRNLNLFASRYSYDLTNQLFIEKCSNRTSTSAASVVSSIGGSMLSSYAMSSSNQSLNVLQIRHVARSIQTHGFGLLDSAVNCTYRALKRLVNLFAKQVSDDKLQASLQKELQQQANQTVTFDRANRLARRFRLSASSLAESIGASGRPASVSVDLDSIRQTITQMGNLLAFVRLLKSGALSCTSSSVDYVPELANLSNLRLAKYAASEFGSAAEGCQPLLEAASNFDRCLADLEDNFTPTTDYMKIIVNLFAGLLSAKREEPSGQAEAGGGPEEEGLRRRAKGREPLRLFFVLVPSLTINYIDQLMNCKERVSSRSSQARFGALISDDGFSLGLAFLLTVLGQASDFRRLRWLEQVRARLEAELDELGRRLADSSFEESLRQTSSMTLRRAQCLRSEYLGLQYTLDSALLLFRSLTVEA